MSHPHHASFVFKKIRAASATSAARNTAITMVVSGMRPAITIFTLPLLASVISDEMLGYWMGVLALTAIFGCINTGISSFVVTEVASSAPVKEVIRYATIIALCSSVVTLAIAGAFMVVVDVPKFFQLVEMASQENAAPVMLVAFLALAVGFPAQIGRFVAIGGLEGYKAQIIEMVALLAGALLMIMAIVAGTDVIVYAVAFMLVPPVVMFVLSSAYIFRRQDPGRFMGSVEPSKLMMKVAEAAPMAAQQGLLAINQQGDVLIIAAMIGPFEAALYGIGQRLAVLANYFITPINLAFWPELTKFRAEGQIQKLRRYFVAQISVNLAFALIFSTLLVLFGNFAITLWMGSDYVLPFVMLSGISSTILTFALVNTMEMMLRAQRRFKLLLRWTAIGVIAGLVSKLVMASQFGAAGVAWTGTVVICLLVGIPYSVAVFHSEAFSESSAARPF